MFQTVRPATARPGPQLSEQAQKVNHSGQEVGQPDPQQLRIVIVAEHASMQFGGEAAIPLHYFRLLRQRGIETWLVVHERTRKELMALFPDQADRIRFVPDTVWHRRLYVMNRYMPKKLHDITFGFIMKLLTELHQRPVIRELIEHNQIDVVHQPILVSPKTPSLIFGLGVPVVIGPLNGGMTYPPGLRHLENRWITPIVGLGRQLSNLLNLLIPGKRLAATLLVANQRTYRALPIGVSGKIVELVENGVDQAVWLPKRTAARSVTRFVFMGRLVDWKAVDWLLRAFQPVSEQVSAQLEIIGDGPMRPQLEQLSQTLGLLEAQPSGSDLPAVDAPAVNAPAVQFSGWLSPQQCAERLQQADVLVLPSLFESGGAVVLEAMAVGLPVIATNWGGPVDYLDETCGILIDPTSERAFIEQLTAAMLKLAQSPALCEQMGHSGQQRVLKYYDWEKKIDMILDIYAETVNRAHRRAANPMPLKIAVG